MKSQFESAEHQAIHTIRTEDENRARLGKITGDYAVRILTNTLTAGERRDRRKRAEQRNPEAFI